MKSEDTQTTAIVLPAKFLRSAIKATPKKDSRLILMGVSVDVFNGAPRICGTDGKVGFIAENIGWFSDGDFSDQENPSCNGEVSTGPTGQPCEFPSIVLDSVEFEAVLKSLDWKNSSPLVMIHAPADGADCAKIEFYTFRTGGSGRRLASANVGIIYGKYPQIEAVLPPLGEKRVEIAYEEKRLNQAAKIASDYSLSGKGEVVLSLKTATSPTVIQSPSESGEIIRTIIMPVRLSYPGGCPFIHPESPNSNPMENLERFLEENKGEPPALLATMVLEFLNSSDLFKPLNSKS